MNFADGNPVPSVDFQYPDECENPLEDIAAERLEQYRRGARNVLRIAVAMFDDSRSPVTTAAKVAVFRSILEGGNETAPEIAARLKVTETYIYRLQREAKKFLQMV